MTIYHHPDGGFYVIASQYPVQMKMDDGRWEPAIYYRRVTRDERGRWCYEGQNHFCTTVARWNERFTRIEV